ncbi:MAG: phosphoribosylaminoimidazolesuccinocarboxamide synthase [bacterium]|nr:phosphoribosylaminoimidazolesuccinocarboxamide synthase [Deltaproteobacteria bacterium]MCP4905730.1 phosphoribosylaminoimidazolesuccinocarboxamide synthase [bacterium]
MSETDFSSGPGVPGLGRRITGKVRDSYLDPEHAPGRRTIVVSDRVSCFDRVVGTIPLKGQILNQMAAFWFRQTQDLVHNHLLEVPDPNVSIVRECKTLPVEFVMRSYLTGSSSTSIWTAYEGGARVFCGHSLPEGMHRHEKLSAPILTPTTKALHGDHDELTSRAALIESGAISEAHYDEAHAIAQRLFAEGTRFAEKQGLILADTKYEMGLDERGEILVIDEIHTPDSSRYWRLDSYEKTLSEGRSPAAIDKEYVRLWLGEQGYGGEGTAPELPIEVRVEAATRYIAAFEKVSGRVFAPDFEAPVPRIRRNLGLG